MRKVLMRTPDTMVKSGRILVWI